VGRLKRSHQCSLGMESPNALRWRFEVGSVCTFTATKSRENMMGTVRRVCRNVKRWRNAAMALRWTAAGMMEAAKGFRRLKAYKHLPVLRAALAAHQSKYVTQRVEHKR
jgi:putative transposase